MQCEPRSGEEREKEADAQTRETIIGYKAY
jgi:hypothetical protein